MFAVDGTVGDSGDGGQWGQFDATPLETSFPSRSNVSQMRRGDSGGDSGDGHRR